MIGNNELDHIVDNLYSVYPILHRNLVKTSCECMNIKLSGPQYLVLLVLYKKGTQSVTEIAEKIYRSKPQMTVLIDKLIKHELVVRNTYEKDRRVIFIKLTEKGNRFVKTYNFQAKENLKNKLKNLSNDDLLNLSSALDVVKNITQKLREDNNE